MIQVKMMMSLIMLVLLFLIAIGVWAVFYTCRKGFNQVINGLESIDDKLEQKNE
jgi:uncharacterized membrane protein